MKYFPMVLTAVLTFWIMKLFVFGVPYDSTDDRFNKERSNMVLYIDHHTGCHYLSRGVFGGLIPRLDEFGGHLCAGKSLEKKRD